MAQVPRYQRQERLGGLPSGTKRAAATALSEGAGVEEARADKLRAFSETASIGSRIGFGVYRDITEREREKANQTALVEADNKLAAAENAFLFGDQGVLKLKGKNAMDAPRLVDEWLTKASGEIEKGLTNDDQRAAYQRLLSNRSQAIKLQVQRHTANEVQAHQAETLEAKITLGTNEAVRSMITDPKLGQARLVDVENAIDTVGRNLGWDDTKRDLLKAQQRSKVHTAVIDQLIASDRSAEARDYFDKVKGANQIDPGLIDDYTDKVNDAGNLAEAQRASDQILAKGGTLTEQRDLAKALPPEQREKALAIIEHEHALKKQEKLEAERTELQGLYNSIDSGNTDLAAIMRSPTYQGIKDLGLRAQIRAYVEDKVRGVPVKTDLTTKLELYRMIRDDPGKFQGLVLDHYRGKLSEQDLEEMARTQVSIAHGKVKEADQTITGLLSTEAVLRRTMGDRYDPKDRASQDLLNALNTKYEEAQIRTGKKPLDTELQEWADFLYQDVVMSEGSWLGGLPMRMPTPFGQITIPGGGTGFSDVVKPVRDLTIADIPQAQQKALQDSLRRRGQTPTPDLVLQEFVATMKTAGRVRTPR